jgi:hypothetical protein
MKLIISQNITISVKHIIYFEYNRNYQMVIIHTIQDCPEPVNIPIPPKILQKFCDFIVNDEEKIFDVYQYL